MRCYFWFRHWREGSVTRFLTSGLIAIALLTWPAMSFADERSVTLTVERMVCSACAYSVKKTLESVTGVKQATVSIADKTAVVIYDDTQADVSVLVAASAKAGFPAAVKR